jgi:anti-sigma factor RsiW
MNCNEARRHWSLYHDSEVDARLHFQLNEHLAGCSTCAEWFHEQSRVEDLMVQKLRAGSPSRELWDAIRMDGRFTRRRRSTQLLLLCSLASMAALVFVALSLWQHGRFSESSRLARLTADLHERLVQGETPTEFASTSDLDVEAYLRQRVAFPVHCPPRSDAGFLVSGAGVCRLSGDDAAYLVGRVAEVPVSIFILPRESLLQFPHDRDVLERETVHHCRAGDAEMVIRQFDRNVVLVVGRTDVGSLRRVVDAYGSYPEDHSG